MHYFLEEESRVRVASSTPFLFRELPDVTIIRGGTANNFSYADWFFLDNIRPTPYKYSLREEFRASSNIGRLNLSPRAVTNREHPDRLSTLIDFIYDPINVRLLAVEQVAQFPS